MAITWIFEYEGERSYVQRQDGLNQITVRTWSNLDQDDAMIIHTDLEAVQLVNALQQELESRDGRLLNAAPNAKRGVNNELLPSGPTLTVAATICSRHRSDNQPNAGLSTTNVIRCTTVAHGLSTPPPRSSLIADFFGKEW